MVSFGYKQIHNELVDNSNYDTIFTHVFKIPRKILYLEKYFLSSFYKDMYKNGIYIIGDKRPILKNTNEYVSNTNKLLNITYLNLDSIFRDTDVIYDKDTLHKVLTKEDFENNRLSFTDYCTFPLFTKDFLNCVTSCYMRNINTEKNLIDSDIFGISHHITLLDNEYRYMDLKDFFYNRGIPDDIKYKDLLLNYELLYTDIIYICNKFNPLSMKIEINNNLIKLMFYDSPSSRRYGINKAITDVEDMSIYEDL